jgi:large subunit ribosomal protein L7e
MPTDPAPVAAKVKVPAPEGIAKAKRAKVDSKVLKAARRKRLSIKGRRLNKEILARGVKYHRAYKSLASTIKNDRKIALDNGNFYVPAEAKVAFVIRIRGINDMPPKEKKILQLLRLRQIFNGVFIKLNKATINMLNRVGPYIAWGYPSKETIAKLVYKRGYGKVKGQRIKLVNNSVVQKTLGKEGQICVEDVIYQITTCGDKFKQVSNFLWPFKMSAPRHGLRAKRKHFVEGGDYGNREEYINRLILRML